jgi:hypothetical protein
MPRLVSLFLVHLTTMQIQGDSNMTGTDLCVNWTLIVPVIFEPPCSSEILHQLVNLLSKE